MYCKNTNSPFVLFCAQLCQRHPVGCCNTEHHINVSCSGLLFTNTNHDALHLAHLLNGLQHREHEHTLCGKAELFGPDIVAV